LVDPDALAFFDEHGLNVADLGKEGRLRVVVGRGLGLAGAADQQGQ